MLRNAFVWCKTELFITMCAILQSKSIEIKMDRYISSINIAQCLYSVMLAVLKSYMMNYSTEIL